MIRRGTTGLHTSMRCVHIALTPLDLFEMLIDRKTLGRWNLSIYCTRSTVDGSNPASPTGWLKPDEQWDKPPTGDWDFATIHRMGTNRAVGTVGTVGIYVWS